jgi:molybdopterin-guanine dinucleotide biosynthesis protein A
MYNDITAVILCGGKSTRMKQNKSFLQLGNQTAIERAVCLMKSQFGNVVIVANEPEAYQFLGLQIFSDIYPNRGPLAGIHSALVNTLTDKLFIISCDIPLITANIVRFIVDYPSQKTIIVPIADGFVQQLCGVYSKDCLPTVERILLDDQETENRHTHQHHRKCKIIALLNELNAEQIDLEKLFPEYQQHSFLNMNYPEDYEKICTLI